MQTISNSDIAVRVENLSKIFPTQSSIKDKFVEMMRLGLGLSPSMHESKSIFWALKDITFTIKKGEAFGIIGRNGAGKSTLLQIIAGTLQPTSGKVEVNGRVNALLELGSGFNPEFTGRENVYLNGSILGFTKAEIDSKFNEILEFSEIGDFIDRPTKNYSSGMFVRLAFSVQALLEPEILIIDEALSVGDVFFVQKCHSKIESMLRKGKTTFIFVTHDMGAIEKYCDRAMTLHKGQVIYCGDKKNAVAKFYRQNIDIKSISDDGLVKIIKNNFFSLLRYELKNKNSFPTKIFSIREQIILNLVISPIIPIDHLIVDCTIKDHRGIPVSCTSTYLQRDFDKVSLKENHHYTLLLYLENILNPGVYTLSVGLKNYSGMFLENIPLEQLESDVSYENIFEIHIIPQDNLLPYALGLVESKLIVEVTPAS